MNRINFGRYLRRTCTLYATRLAALAEASRKRPGFLLKLEYRPARLHLVGWLAAATNTLLALLLCGLFA